MNVQSEENKEILPHVSAYLEDNEVSRFYQKGPSIGQKSVLKEYYQKKVDPVEEKRKITSSRCNVSTNSTKLLKYLDKFFQKKLTGESYIEEPSQNGVFLNKMLMQSRNARKPNPQP
mmetsp:Transcript_39940/g.38493  ORF Transcript_39940/g.38493 Transcript_39940/m.38493 type:complete len:117 (+) Transcript_39940:1362-1712(+)